MAPRHLVTLAIVFSVAAAVYGQTAQAPFVYEDRHVSPDVPWTIGTVLDVPGRYLSAWSVSATQKNAPLAHAVNVVLHLVAGGLVARIAFLVAGATASCGAALLMLWHPLNSQAVWYVTGRSDLQVTVGILLATVAAISSGWWRAPVIVLGLLIAAASKEIGVIGVPLVVLTLLCWKPVDTQHAPAALLWIGGGAVLGRAWAEVGSWLTMVPGRGGPDVPWTEFVVRQIGLTWGLLVTLVTARGFSIDHDALALSWPWLVGSVVATGAVTTLIVWAWRRHRVLAWSLAFTAIAVAPRLVVPTNEFIAERHLYLAMVGPAVLFGSLVAWWLRSDPADRKFWQQFGARSRALTAWPISHA